MNEMMNSFERTYCYPFSAWDIRLYLNSHPDDRQALRLYETYQERCDPCNYAAVPLCFCAKSGQYSLIRWPWVDDPWPWEREANTEGGRI